MPRRHTKDESRTATIFQQMVRRRTPAVTYKSSPLARRKTALQSNRSAATNHRRQRRRPPRRPRRGPRLKRRSRPPRRCTRLPQERAKKQKATERPTPNAPQPLAMNRPPPGCTNPALPEAASHSRRGCCGGVTSAAIAEAAEAVIVPPASPTDGGIPPGPGPICAAATSILHRINATATHPFFAGGRRHHWMQRSRPRACSLATRNLPRDARASH